MVTEEKQQRFQKETPLWFSFLAMLVGVGLLIFVSYEHSQGMVSLKKGTVEFSRDTNPLMFWVGLFLQSCIGMGIIGVFASRFMNVWNAKRS